MKNILLAFTLTFLASHFSAKAQINIPNLPFNYSQDFTTFGPNNSPWFNNSTLPGWYFVISTNGTGTLDAPILDSDDGNATSAFSRNYGAIASLDRALGSQSGSAGDIELDLFYGSRFLNSTPFDINNITINYTGEQWRRGNVQSQTLRFFYRIGGSDFLANNTGWSSFPALDFISPQTGAALALNGNNVANQQSFSVNSSASPNPIIIPPNSEFWIRWVHGDSFTNAHGLAIDDFTIYFSTNVVNPPPPTNNIPDFSDIKLNLKKPKLTKTLLFNGANGFPFKAHILATISTPIQASYIAFATGATNIPTNFITAGLFKPITKPKSKLAKQGVKVVARHKGNANKPGKGIATDTASVTLIVKVDGAQGTNTGSVLFTNVLTARVQ